MTIHALRSAARTTSSQPVAQSMSAAQPQVRDPKAKSSFAKDALMLTGVVAGGHTLATVTFSGTDPEATSFLRPVTTAAKDKITEEFAQLGVNFKPELKVDAQSSFVKDGSSTIHLNRFKFSPVLRPISQSSMESTEFMHLVRHEAGHAFFNRAMSRTLSAQYKAAFGASPNATYDMTFWTQMEAGFKYSKSPDFVSKYAQTHAAEDFAETFGVYMRLGGNKAAIGKYVAEAGESAAMKAKFTFVDDLVKLAARRL